MAEYQRHQETDVAIVGGGVAGTAAACAFARAGLRACVIERRDLARDPNRGDVLHESAVEHLRAWGAFDELERRGAFAVRQSLFTNKGGSLRVRVDQSIHPLTVLNHAEIEAALADAAGRLGAAFVRGRATGAERTEAGWLVATEQGTVPAKLLVGADGSASSVREWLGIGVEATPYPQSVVIAHAPFPSWLPDDTYCAVLSPDGPVVVVPTTPRGRARIAIGVPSETGSSGDIAAYREVLRERDPRLGELELEQRGASYFYKLSRQHARTYTGPRAALVGDAAHVTHPAGGQGMSMAIEDAAALARLLAPALHEGRSAEIGDLLREYERERRPRNARAMRAADTAARRTLPGKRNYRMTVAGLKLISRVPGGAKILSRQFGGAR